MEEQQHKEKDEEIQIDFSKVKDKIKGWFGKKKDSQEEIKTEKTSDDEVDVKESFKKGWKETQTFTKKYSIILLILIPIFLSIFIRIQPAHLPLMDESAAGSLESFNKNLIAQSVKQQYPNLPDANINKLIEEEWFKLKKDKVYIPQNGQIAQVPYKQGIELYANSFKSRLRNEDGQTYLLAIDPYYYARHTRNLIENGHVGDEIRDGISWNNHRVAPLGDPADHNWHIYINLFTYKISQIFGNNDLLRAIFFVPLIISTLAIIPCFFIIKKVAGNFGATVGSTLLAVHNAFMTRTVAGFADTDPYNVFFPLLIAWIFLEAFEAKTLKKKIILSSLSGICVGIYSRFWTGWWYIFDFIIATIIIYLMYVLIINRKEIKQNIKDLMNTGLPFFIFSTLGVGILYDTGFFAGINHFFNAFLGFPLSIINIKDVATTKIWPNVLTTVAELNPASVEQTISAMGGTLFFALAVLGIILTLFIKNKKGKVDIKYMAFLAVWFIGTIYGSTKGLRFTLLLVPAFSIAIGCLIGILYELAAKKIPKALNINKIFIQVCFIVLAIVLLINPVKAGYNQAVHEIPSMNDAWWSSLTNIKISSNENAIITSWWDFGHWFQYVADRSVTFDGASQDKPQAHWVGKLLQTSNEKESVAILRMIDCGGNNAYKYLNKELNNDLQSIKIIKEIILMKKQEAINYLNNKSISQSTIDLVIENSHCTPPEAFVIASEDMIGKSGVWGHFGTWNFEKASMIQKVKGKSESEGITILKEEFGLDEEKALQYYDEIRTEDANRWISPWPGYVSNLNTCQKVNDETFQCVNTLNGNQIPLIFNTTSKETYVLQGDEKIHISSSVYMNENGSNEIKYNDSKIGVSALIIPIGNTYKMMFTDPLLVNGMFTRMFFTQGHGLKCFNLFDEQTQITGGKIYVYSVDWECNSKNNVYFKTNINESITN